MISLRYSSLLLLFALLPFASHAQSGTAPATEVGTLMYFEGSVDVKTDGSWSAATIEQPLRSDHTLRTGPEATVEIKWKNGSETTIGPQTTQKLGPLYEKVTSQSGQGGDSMVGDFVELFQGEDESSDEVGGVRRASVKTEDTPGPGEVYWKTFDEVSFSDAQQQFQEGNYAKAIQNFHLFLQQNPGHTQAPKAKLGMGLSYLKLNNPQQARTALETLVSDHPNDPLAERARQLLDEM